MDKLVEHLALEGNLCMNAMYHFFYYTNDYGVMPMLLIR